MTLNEIIMGPVSIAPGEYIKIVYSGSIIGYYVAAMIETSSNRYFNACKICQVEQGGIVCNAVNCGDYNEINKKMVLFQIQDLPKEDEHETFYSVTNSTITVTPDPAQSKFSETKGHPEFI